MARILNYEIKITGSGTKEQLEHSLRELARSIQDAKGDAELDGAEWEDAILMTEIKAL